MFQYTKTLINGLTMILNCSYYETLQYDTMTYFMST